MTQEQLFQKLSSGDSSVIGFLYDQYGASLFGLVLRIVGDRELAENVLQDTFVKIWKSGNSFDPEKAGIFIWMQRIARNTAIDATRSAYFKQRAETTNTDQLVYMKEENPFNPDHVGLRDTLGKLEEKYRVVIEKAYFEGYTHQEIEEELGVPLGTVKTRMRQGMLLLRQYLTEVAPLLAIIACL